MGGRVEGWKDGRMEAKAGLRIAYSNQKLDFIFKNNLYFNITSSKC